ncbi:MAG: TetR/AcrR family transcriptional regulator [Mycobacteriales bacterium]
MTTAYSGSGNIHRSLELLWHGKDRLSRGPKPGLTLDQIVAAAVSLADREGLPALSMRAVAMGLGVGTMSLYRYVPSKGELLDLMLDHVYNKADTSDWVTNAGWRASMERIARGKWALFHRHPWLLQVNQARPVLGPNALTGFEFALSAFDGLDLTGGEKIKIIMAVEHYVTGTARTYIFQQQAAEQSGMTDEEFWEAQHPILLEALRGGAFPEIAGLEENAFVIGGEEALEFGLVPILDGIAAFIAGRKETGPHRNVVERVDVSG